MPDKLPWSSNPEVSPCCCEEEGCCLYPASGLGTLYSESILPDELESTFLTGVTTWTKSGDHYIYGNRTLQVINGVWTVTHNLNAEPNTTLGNCLVSGVFKDRFPDNLVLNIAPPSGWSAACPNNILLTRISQCVWQSVLYNNGAIEGRYSISYIPEKYFGKLWAANAAVCYATAFYGIGDDDGPIGDYGSFAPGFSATVSAAL